MLSGKVIVTSMAVGFSPATRYDGFASQARIIQTAPNLKGRPRKKKLSVSQRRDSQSQGQGSMPGSTQGSAPVASQEPCSPSSKKNPAKLKPSSKAAGSNSRNDWREAKTYYAVFPPPCCGFERRWNKTRRRENQWKPWCCRPKGIVVKAGCPLAVR
ncbi:unnamed protein product [Boreogadus saida]